MFNFFKKAEDHFKDEEAGVEAYIAKFKQAAAAAEAEIKKIDLKVAATVDKYDAKVEAAYSKYMDKEAKYLTKTSKVEAEAAARNIVLAEVAAKAAKAIDNHNAIYLGK